MNIKDYKKYARKLFDKYSPEFWNWKVRAVIIIGILMWLNVFYIFLKYYFGV
jgi:uncharacterized membrane-anchored protein